MTMFLNSIPATHFTVKMVISKPFVGTEIYQDRCLFVKKKITEKSHNVVAIYRSFGLPGCATECG
jgi:hypothetical protein